MHVIVRLVFDCGENENLVRDAKYKIMRAITCVAYCLKVPCCTIPIHYVEKLFPAHAAEYLPQ